ncbi:MAG: hypothetical protein ACE5HS_06035 [bacterium]
MVIFFSTFKKPVGPDNWAAIIKEKIPQFSEVGINVRVSLTEQTGTQEILFESQLKAKGGTVGLIFRDKTPEIFDWAETITWIISPGLILLF